MRGVIIATEYTRSDLIARPRFARIDSPRSRSSCSAALLVAQTRRSSPGEPAGRRHAGRVRRVSNRPRRLPRSGDCQTKDLARPLTARAAARATACRPSGARVPSPKCAPAKRGPRGEFVALDPSGETLFHLFSVPSHSCQPQIPADATMFARRVPIPLFGAGLVEAIPDETLLALEDPVDRNRDGVSGRAAIVIDVATGERRVGRFGWKAQHATLLAFSADAYRNEMGITNELFSQELAVGVSSDRMQCAISFRTPRTNAIRDRAARHRQLRELHEVPGARSVAAPSTNRRVTANRCSARWAAPHATRRRCKPGRAANPLFHRRQVPLFSDLLLHDIGTGDGIAARRGCAGGDSHAGALGHFASDGRSCTTGLRPHSRKRLAVTRTRRSWRGADSSARPKAIAPPSSRSSGLSKWTVSRSS